jgi:hypothetical protein
MSDKITQTELDELIKRKIKEKGLSNDIGEDKISEIKNKISLILKKPELSEDVPANNQPTQPVVAQTNVEVPQNTINSPESITQTTSVSKEAVELAKREGELEEKERDFAQKQSELTLKEKELLEKEQALEYKPQIPAVLEGIGNEKLFVFDENELSLGAEALSNTPFRLMSNPDNKRSMMELWATEGKRGAEIYQVKFEKLGEIIFNPFEGTSNFAKKPIEDGKTPLDVPAEGLTPEDAQASQEPTQPMVDSVEPMTNATLPLSNDMGLNSVDLEDIIKTRIDSIIMSHFKDKYPKM